MIPFSHVFNVGNKPEIRDLTGDFSNYRVLGNGSNIIVSGEGITEPVLRLDGDFRKITVRGNELIAGAGALLKDVIKKSAKKGLCGLENLSGIPASVGGAVFKNAGAFGGSVSDVLKWVKFYRAGKEHRISGKKISASYRTGPVKIPSVISEVCFSLSKKPEEKISARVKEIIKLRTEKGFIYKNGSGCIFKNPSKIPAGKLIEACGCSHFRSGGVFVSPLHANIFVLRGDRISWHAHELMNKIRTRVYAKKGVYLEPLVEFWGVFSK
ncbi:MAG: FAD-binding protein [Elusimicrobiota bacterium]|nr:FAD-binding protein [Elusimicrobiota bacterium]